MPRDIYQQALPASTRCGGQAPPGRRRRTTARIRDAAVDPAQRADELGKLAGLRDQGVLSDTGFQNAKQRVLAQHGLA
jgi:hypothetical protein